MKKFLLAAVLASSISCGSSLVADADVILSDVTYTGRVKEAAASFVNTIGSHKLVVTGVVALGVTVYLGNKFKAEISKYLGYSK